MNEIITYDVQLQVRVRKNEVNIKGLQQLLRTNKKFSNKQIAEKLNIPLTQVEHYFRTDKYFAVPDPNIWYELKKLLNITDNSFDAQITEFVVKPNEYDMGNRLYDSKGIMPTILADSGNKMVVVYEK